MVLFFWVRTFKLDGFGGRMTRFPLGRSCPLFVVFSTCFPVGFTLIFFLFRTVWTSPSMGVVGGGGGGGGGTGLPPIFQPLTV